MNKVMVVALYLRLSVEDYVARIGEQDESNSITAQEHFTGFCGRAPRI